MSTRQNKRTNIENGSAQNELPLFAALHAPLSFKVLRLPEVIARVGLKRASLYQRIQTGVFPKPIPLGPRAVGWLEHEIDSWLDGRLRMRGMRPKKGSVKD